MKQFRILLPLFALFLCILLVGCNKTPSGSSSEQESESTTVRDENTVIVTFRFGVGSWTSEEKTGYPATYKYTVEVPVEKGDDAKYLADERIDDVPGYVFDGWNVSASQLRDLEEDVTVDAMYIKLETFTYTFKNTDGSVIKTGTAYEFADISNEAPATRGLYYYPESMKATLTDPVAYVVDDTTYWIPKADESRIATTVAVPIGYVFMDWKASEAGVNLTNLKKNNVVFTAQYSPADAIIERVEAGTITKDNMLDKSLYKKLDQGLQRRVIYNKIDGVTNGDMSIITKYDEIAANSNGVYADGLAAAKAVSAAEGNAYTSALNNWNKAARGLDATFYMAWDGEYVYFLAEVEDSTVVTQGKNFMLAQRSCWQTDCVEVWYAFNNDFHKVSLDACGYKLFSDDSDSAYLQYLQEQKMIKSKVTKDSGEALDVSGYAGPTIIPNATGYTVAYCFPAYSEPTDPNADLSNKENWGRRMERGDVFYCSVQINNLSDCGDPAVIEQMIKEGPNSSAVYERSSAAKQKSMQLAAVGCQTKNAGDMSKGTLRFALG